MIVIKNANIYSPEHLGVLDILVGGGKILSIEKDLGIPKGAEVIDLASRMALPGFIDQHVHITGAGGKAGFASMTPEISIEELLINGTTTVVGLLGTDGSSRSIKSLYAKTRSLEQEGMSAYMLTGYYGLDPVHLMGNVQDDMIFIDKVLGCKIAIADIRSSYPEAKELVRLLRQVRVGGMIGEKKGILHIHLGNLRDKMDLLFELVHDYEFPIEHISPTHVGRTKALFDQAIEFAKLGGIIDITTGASKYTEPYLSVKYALEQGVEVDKMTFSSDGNAGLDKKDNAGNNIGFRRAPVSENLSQMRMLVQENILPIGEAVKIISTNPAKNLGLKNKGRIAVGMDADICVMDNDLLLTDIICKGKQVMKDKNLTLKGTFS